MHNDYWMEQKKCKAIANLAKSVIMIALRRFVVHKIDRVMFRERRLVKVRKRQPVLLDNKINITKFRQVKIYTRNRKKNLR